MPKLTKQEQLKQKIESIKDESVKEAIKLDLKKKQQKSVTK